MNILEYISIVLVTIHSLYNLYIQDYNIKIIIYNRINFLYDLYDYIQNFITNLYNVNKSLIL